MKKGIDKEVDNTYSGQNQHESHFTSKYPVKDITWSEQWKQLTNNSESNEFLGHVTVNDQSQIEDDKNFLYMGKIAST